MLWQVSVKKSNYSNIASFWELFLGIVSKTEANFLFAQIWVFHTEQKHF